MKALILSAFVVAGVAEAQTAAIPAAVPADMAIPVDTVVDIEIATPLNSKDNKIGEMFPIRLALPIEGADGAVLVPAGTDGQGEVIHAAKARALGKAGEMILAARFLQCGDTRIPLGHFKFGGAGRDPTKATMTTGAAAAGMSTFVPGAALVAVPLAFISGGEFRVPSGTHATARTTAAVALSKETAARCGVR